MSTTGQRLAAIEQLLEDFELILTEKSAVANWVDDKLALLPRRHEPVEQARMRIVKRGLLQMRHATLLQLETYREYMDGLRERRRELLSGGG